jgi:hypothetical protein
VFRHLDDERRLDVVGQLVPLADQAYSPPALTDPTVRRRRTSRPPD